MTRYKLLAVDVDGTLLGAGSVLSAAHAGATRSAKLAGLTVCLCTGRSVAETRPVWQACRLPGPADPLICVAGALVCEADTARTLHMAPMDPAGADAGWRAIARTGRSVVALVDGWRWGFDYYFLEGQDADLVRRCWLDRHVCRFRVVRSLAEDPQRPEILRLTAIADPAIAGQVEANLVDEGRPRLHLGRIHAPNLGVDVLECFSPAVSKWAGIRYVAQGMRIARRDIVAVGDDVNDLPMLAGAGLAVAMGNAVPAVRQAADITIARHDQDGLAPFIEQLLAGQYD